MQVRISNLKQVVIQQIEAALLPVASEYVPESSDPKAVVKCGFFGCQRRVHFYATK
jgi:hypothetical protein